jgi:hypothetical protein
MRPRSLFARRRKRHREIPRLTKARTTYVREATTALLARIRSADYPSLGLGVVLLIPLSLLLS